jgi:hypothetical protein
MRRSTFRGRAALALVPPLPEVTAPEVAAPTVSFCGHCGSEPAASAALSPTRVCAACGLGLILQCRANVAPPAGGAFIVIDDSLSVCAVSDAAERLLATLETDAVNQPVTRLLVPADAEARGDANLAASISWAARGNDAVHRTAVRPANTFGVRMTARIAACGPPRAALLVFE